MKKYTPEELAKEDGKNGRKCLVAIKGKVYDVSDSKKWRNGLHINRHPGGRDLTTEMLGAPHDLEVFKPFSVVGDLDKKYEPAARDNGLKSVIEGWLSKHPFFTRHPHPSIVHFPVAAYIMALLFEVAGIALDISDLRKSSFYCLIFGTITLPVSILSGYFTWWINYNCGKLRAVKEKIWFSWILLVITGLSILLKGINSDFYLLSILVAAGVVSYIAFVGGKLTFPYEREK